MRLPTPAGGSALDLLKDRIDPSRTPFSTRGSRLLIYCQPQGPELRLQLAERLGQIDPDLGGYSERPPYVRRLTFLDDEGRALPYQLTTYPHALFFRTRIGLFGLAFHDPETLAIGLPADHGAGVELEVDARSAATPQPPGGAALRPLSLKSDPAAPVQTREAPGGGRTLRVQLAAGPAPSLHLSALRPGLAPTAPVPFVGSLQAAEARWQAWFQQAPSIEGPFRPAYAYAWWVMANNLVAPYGELRFEAMMPSKHKYIGIWNWDSAFHALAFRHADPELARDQLRTLLGSQRPDGMLPDVVHDEGVVDRLERPVPADVTKPPVMAWAALKIHQLAPDLDFLREIYPPLQRWNQWWTGQSDPDWGLAHYRHPYSSGLDDNPLWDHGFPVVSPDLNSYLAVQMQSLQRIASELGRAEEAAEWGRRAKQQVGQMLAHLYDGEANLFWATHRRQPIPEVTPFNLLPLWAGGLPVDVSDHLIRRLTDPETFWAPHPLATVARNTDSYSPETMWRGPVWINTNYFFIEALMRAGRPDLAQRLRQRTLDLVAANEGIFEYYNPETGRPAATAAPSFGWSAALFIDLLLADPVAAG